MSDTNKHNLKREIPLDVKRAVRQRVGFGCVICGFAFYHYDHFSPEFADAKTHDPLGITLLCPNHHDGKTRGRISKEKIISHNDNPICLTNGFSHGPMELTSKPLKIQIGNTVFISPNNILTIEGNSIIKISEPPDSKSPMLLTFTPSEKPTSSKIIDNEWLGGAVEWDIETVGNKIIVREKKGKIILEIENILNDKVIFHKININYKGVRVETKNIAAKQFGHIKIKEQKVVRILNTEGREVARFGALSDSQNEIKWANALEVINDYMNPNLSNMNLINGDLYYIHNSDNPSMTNCNIKSSTVNVGIAHEHAEFSKFVNKLSQRKPNAAEKLKFRNTMKSFRHTKLIDQLTKDDIQYLNKLEKKI